MRPGGGPHKGGEFERSIAKQLSLWLSGGTKKDAVWRASGSGARATVAFRKGERVRQAGDLCAVAAEAEPFFRDVFLECKHLRQCSFTAALSGKGDLITIWKKLCRQAADHERQPVLIIKQNRKPTLWVAAAYMFSDVLPEPRGTIHLEVYFDMYINYLADILQSPLPENWQPPRDV